MSVIRVARHGETTWNSAGRYQGRRESTLSPLGIAQARALARALACKPIARIASSPLARCLATAHPLATALGLAVVQEPLLLEIGHGTWEGRDRDEIARNDPQRFYDWKQRPQRVHFAGGESVSDVLARWTRFADSCDQNVETLVITHDVVVRLAILTARGGTTADLWKPKVVNAGFAEFSLAGGRWDLQTECVDEHLAGLAANADSQAL